MKLVNIDNERELDGQRPTWRNGVLHEWEYAETDRPQPIVAENGEVSFDRPEPTDNLVTWVYDTDSYVPAAKLVDGKRYGIVSDYIGRPVQAYDEHGTLVWQADYDIYGNLLNLKGDRKFVPFRQLGQYEDEETGLYYNRFRYYDPNTGGYISQDPIGLAGNNPTLYGYVYDCNKEVDSFGLDCDSIVKKASQWQGKGDYPGIDDWHAGKLKKGDVIYGGIPGQSEFYLSKESLNAAGGSKEALWKSVQVKPHDVFGYRSKVQAYEVLEDIDVATSITKANPQWGKGGATQIFVENFETVLQAKGNPIILI